MCTVGRFGIGLTLVTVSAFAGCSGELLERSLFGSEDAASNVTRDSAEGSETTGVDVSTVADTAGKSDVGTETDSGKLDDSGVLKDSGKTTDIGNKKDTATPDTVTPGDVSDAADTNKPAGCKTSTECSGIQPKDLCAGTATCTKGVCTLIAVGDGTTCDDGDICTTTDACKAGACKSGKSKVCDDGNPCSAGSCDGKSGVCAFVAAAESSSYGNGKGQCLAGNCRHKDGPMVLIPAGKFWMGCADPLDLDCNTNEKPQHAVMLSAYWIDQYEVTLSAYKKCVDAGKCLAPIKKYGTGISGYYNWLSNRSDQHPINGISWEQADLFCSFVSGRLPTEAEWEKAARGGCEKYPGKD